MRRPLVLSSLLLVIVLSGCYGASGCVTYASWHEPGLFATVAGSPGPVAGWPAASWGTGAGNVTLGLVEMSWRAADADATVRSLALRRDAETGSARVLATWHANETPDDLAARLEAFMGHLDAQTVPAAQLAEAVRESGRPAGTEAQGVERIPLLRGVATVPVTWDPERIRPMLDASNETSDTPFGTARLEHTTQNGDWGSTFDLPVKKVRIPEDDRTGDLAVDAWDRVEHEYHTGDDESDAAYQEDVRVAFERRGLLEPSFSGFQREDNCRDGPPESRPASPKA